MEKFLKFMVEMDAITHTLKVEVDELSVENVKLRANHEALKV